jgi:N-acetylglutamate synthase-like GNAT family acetyltransferase
MSAAPAIRPVHERDRAAILAIVNDAARAYRGVIPADRWHEPYMDAAELDREVADGVAFSVAEIDGRVVGAMGLQDRGDVALIRHAYVASDVQKRGVGGALLRDLVARVERPVLVGTWAAAGWAIAFYERHGFAVVPHDAKERLLRTYWSIPARQVETSVVLADARWRARERATR